MRIYQESLAGFWDTLLILTLQKITQLCICFAIQCIETFSSGTNIRLKFTKCSQENLKSSKYKMLTLMGTWHGLSPHVEVGPSPMIPKKKLPHHLYFAEDTCVTVDTHTASVTTASAKSDDNHPSSRSRSYVTNKPSASDRRFQT